MIEFLVKIENTTKKLLNNIKNQKQEVYIVKKLK